MQLTEAQSRKLMSVHGAYVTDACDRCGRALGPICWTILDEPGAWCSRRCRDGRRSGEIEFKVGEKGGVSVYGLGRFPVTLYYEQWIRLLSSGDKLREYLEENKAAGKLKLKEK